MQKIKKNDDVTVLAGKYKGKSGTVLKICDNDRVIVEGINIVKKCVKPNPQINETGGIVEREASIHISNVGLFDPSAKKASRIGFKFLDNNKKVRFYKASGNELS